MVVSEQGNTTFDCHATGTPRPQISWMHNGQNINRLGDERFQSRTIEISGNSVRSRLTATHLRVRDSGSFVCVASSEVDDPNGPLLILHTFSKTSLSVLSKSLKSCLHIQLWYWTGVIIVDLCMRRGWGKAWEHAGAWKTQINQITDYNQEVGGTRADAVLVPVWVYMVTHLNFDITYTVVSQKYAHGR